MWVTVDLRPWADGHNDIPPVPGVYVFVLDGVVLYVGSTTNLKNRIASYAPRYTDYFGWKWDERFVNAVLKVSPSKRYGDWLMRELRLIRRLRPTHNVAGKPRERRA